MSAVEVTISGVLYDRLNRTSQNVVLIGEAMLTGLGVGGGPIIPPPGIGPQPPWYPGHPEHPIPPVVGGGPIIPPITPVPPDKPNIPPPGSPPIIISGTQPVQPIAPPPAVVIEYPGIGKVVVPQPVNTGPEPK